MLASPYRLLFWVIVSGCPPALVGALGRRASLTCSPHPQQLHFVFSVRSGSSGPHSHPLFFASSSACAVSHAFCGCESALPSSGLCGQTAAPLALTGDSSGVTVVMETIRPTWSDWLGVLSCVPCTCLILPALSPARWVSFSCPSRGSVCNR